MHFWAFFDRHARENDYLWGRLDGAAHLIGILLGKNHPDYRATCLRAFAAILDEDESRAAARVRARAGDSRRALGLTGYFVGSALVRQAASPPPPRACPSRTAR